MLSAVIGGECREREVDGSQKFNKYIRFTHLSRKRSECVRTSNRTPMTVFLDIYYKSYISVIVVVELAFLANLTHKFHSGPLSEGG